ncbi:MAG: phosphorylase [Methylococcales bacterium]|nr:phosphorylase [Methylococcales bacterium]
MITGIVVALPQELKTLTTQKIVKGQCVFLNKTLVLAYSGAGVSNAEASAKLLIAQGATRLISWGCAGALSTGLQSGDLVLADTLITSEDETIAVNADWHRHVKAVLEKLACESKFALRCGSLLESKTLVSTSHDKQHKHHKTKAIALDMESVAIAKVAQHHALPFLAIRAIADPVTMDLPQAVSHALNQQGDIELGKLLSYLLWHPSELKSLITLGQHFNAAKKTLKLITKELEHLAPELA